MEGGGESLEVAQRQVARIIFSYSDAFVTTPETGVETC